MKFRLVCFFVKTCCWFSAVFGPLFLSNGPAWAQDVRATIQNSKPKYLLSQDSVSGLCGEIYTELQKELSKIGINFLIPNIEMPIKRILRDLEEGNADLFCGAGRNEKREEKFIYSIRPVYAVSNVLVSHRDDNLYPKSFDDLRSLDFEIGAFYGTTSSQFLKMQSGIRVNDSFTSLDEALERIGNKQRLRLFYYHDLGLVYLVNTSGLPLRVIPTRFRTVPQWMLYSRKMDMTLLGHVEKALLDIEISGRLSQIQRKYTASP
ncbi:MAG: transporter substrate-binding domain-containing protein [Alphaproteobacteria bacterium]|nr:transporter substrate-binding domain-containing protein [Alphaproteobacteria bacterium]